MTPSHVEAHSCEYCECFGIDLSTPMTVNSELEVFRTSWATVAQLRDGDRQGCLFCATILDKDQWTSTLSADEKKDSFGPGIETKDWPRRPRWTHLRNLPDMALFSDGVAAKLSFPFHHQHNDYVFIEFAKNDSLKDLSMSRLSLQISAREGTPASEYIRARPPERHADSEENFKRMRGWLNTCVEKHQQCKIRSHRESLPTRLIRLSESPGGNLEIKLVPVGQGCKENIQYAALSYLWGGKQALTLCKANVDALSRSIPMTRLPPTLSDAIKVCRELHIQYLWVDALCIIQDDDTSKMTEIPKMGNIYKGAIITISASSASNTTEGFLKGRKSPFDPNRVSRLPFYDEQGKQSECFVTSEGVDQPREPLDHRGWTLQENLLSTRLLVFKSHQLQWKCLELDTVDGYRQGTFPLLPLTMPPAPPTDSQHWQDWRKTALCTYERIVREYTMRKLTLEDDMPLAISGIAAEFGRMLGDGYVAGHWTSTLPLSLIWRENPYGGFKHSSKYRGPTWSWISAGAAIGFESFFSRAQGPLSDCVIKARVVEIRPKLISRNAPYGAFGEGTTLVLEARLLRVVTIPCFYGPEPLDIDGTDHQCSIRGSVIYDENEDTLPREGLGGRSPILLELCAVSGPDTRQEVLGLVLEPVAGKKMTFTRSRNFRMIHEIENLPEYDESEKVNSTWLREKLDQRNLFNTAPVVKVDLV